MTSRLRNDVNLRKNDRYDLLLFDFPDGFPNSKLKFTLGATPRRITGVEKVVQVFLKCLTTRKGSDVINTNLGTEFQDFMQYSNVGTYSNSEAKSAIEVSVRSAVDQAKNILNSNKYSLESQMDSVEVLDARQGDEYTIVQLRVLTKAGKSAPISVPFTSTGLALNA